LAGIFRGVVGPGEPLCQSNCLKVMRLRLPWSGLELVLLLSILTTWLGVHYSRVNADRLFRLVSERQEPRVLAYFAAVAGWLHQGRR
jgi:hypothetical protein